MKRVVVTIVLAVALAQSAFPSQARAAGGSHPQASKYAGQEKRPIKSLSEEDIAELKRGGGWGLARAAELNGVPGPAHLLEMKEQIKLSAEQVSKITAIFQAMKARAVTLGIELIRLERELEAHFRDRTITDTVLQSSLEAIAEVRKDLRYTHLSAHLKTPLILSETQITRYNALRGYSAADPCGNVPAGHDAAMWRKHNGCD